MIDPFQSFSLFALCEIIYSGRAESTLELGRYLIIHKADGSLLIHGAENVPPRNYQGPKAILEVDGQTLISRTKKETITIKIKDIISYTPLSEWSNSKIAITKTEKELVHKILVNWHDYFDDEFEMILTEFPTEVGTIDIYGITNDSRYIVETKRGTANIGDCSQLKRYVECFMEGPLKVYGFLASPRISPRAQRYLDKHNLKRLIIDF